MEEKLMSVNDKIFKIILSCYTNMISLKKKKKRRNKI